ncbi:hypothetical protein V8E53_010998 [Lactarius tabidus]
MSRLHLEQRIITAKVIKRFILRAKKRPLLSSMTPTWQHTVPCQPCHRLGGTSAITATPTPPQSLPTGMSKSLASLGITFRRDTTNFMNSIQSKTKSEGFGLLQYFFLEE